MPKVKPVSGSRFFASATRSRITSFDYSSQAIQKTFPPGYYGQLATYPFRPEARKKRIDFLRRVLGELAGNLSSQLSSDRNLQISLDEVLASLSHLGQVSKGLQNFYTDYTPYNERTLAAFFELYPTISDPHESASLIISFAARNAIGLSPFPVKEITAPLLRDGYLRISEEALTQARLYTDRLKSLILESLKLFRSAIPLTNTSNARTDDRIISLTGTDGRRVQALIDSLARNGQVSDGFHSVAPYTQYPPLGDTPK